MVELISYLQQMNPYVYLVLLGIVLPAYLYMTRLFYLNIFDPVALYIIMNSFGICLVAYMSIFNDIAFKTFFLFIFNVCVFWFGYAFAFRRCKFGYGLNLVKTLAITKSMTSYIGICLLTSITIAASILLFMNRGLPIFAENPSDAKILLYEGGFGPVRYIHMNFIPIIIGLALTGIVVMTVENKNRLSFLRVKIIRYALILMTISLLLFTMGSKGALLSILTFMSIQLYYLKICDQSSLYHKFVSTTYLVFGCAVAYLILIAFLTTGNVNEILSHLIIRFVAAGDVFFFYYKYELSNSFINYNFIDYVSYILNPITSIMRLDLPDFPMGSTILHLATGWPLSSFGPNAQFPVIGDIFFGPAFSWLYSFTLGLIVGYLRVGSVIYLSRCGAYGSALYLYLWSSSIIIPGDLILFIQLTYMFLLFTAPVYLVTYIVSKTFVSTSRPLTADNNVVVRS